MQHLQYGINSLSKFAIARCLPLKRNLKTYYFRLPSLRHAPRRHSPLATGRASADHARVINAFILWRNDVTESMVTMVFAILWV